MPENYVKGAPISLRNHPLLDEKWLQKEIVGDPAILGRGDLELRSPPFLEVATRRRFLEDEALRPSRHTVITVQTEPVLGDFSHDR